MWMAILNLKSPDNNLKNAKKQPTENQNNTKTKISVKWGFGFHIWLTGGNSPLPECNSF